MEKTVLVMLIFFNNIVRTKTEKEQIFLGGALNYYLTESQNGNVTANVELITGWVLGKGPCGSNCSKASIGRSTLSTRNTMENIDQYYYGRFQTDYQKRGTNTSPEYRDLTSEIKDNMSEIVLAVSEKGNWEQALTKFSFQLLPNMQHEDLNFDGDYWRNLSLQYIVSATDQTIDWKIKWHLQAKIQIETRNDTRKRNHCPTTLTRPLYRVKLNEISAIEIPNSDDDGDFIKCSNVKNIEEGIFGSVTRIKGVSISEKCKVTIEAFNSMGYMDNTWIAILINVRDYPSKVIKFGNATYTSSVSMCSTAVQFVVQILEKLETPVFVPPTKETNHEFHLFSGATWSTNIYAQSSENTTISEFIVTARNMEHFHLTDVLEYNGDMPRVGYTEISWTPTAEEEARHIVCITAIDSTGVESKEQRCFVVNVQPQTFNKGTAVSTTKPYFIDAPGIDDFLKCPVDATCVISMFVKSNKTVASIDVQHSSVDSYSTGSPYQVMHNGEMVFKVDLKFQHPTSGYLNICMEAIDVTGEKSDLLCLTSAFHPEDPCFSAPCINSGRCVMGDDLSGLYNCECYNGYTGRTCEIAPTPCNPNPCVHGLCFNTIMPYFCHCTDGPESSTNGYTGINCETKIDYCSAAHCNNRSMCVNGIENYTCDCFPRYGEDNCTEDYCENSTSETICIDEQSCPTPCENSGICKNGMCQCSLWFTGLACNESIADAYQKRGIGIKFIAPTPSTGSIVYCFVNNQTITDCHISVYILSTAGHSPNISIETTPALQSGTSHLPIIEQSVHNVYTCTIFINGQTNDLHGHYVCVYASDSIDNAKKDQTCYKLQFIPTNIAAIPKGLVHFISPTQLEDSKFVCYLSEQCGFLLATNVNGGKCEKIISSADGITVFDPIMDGQISCNYTVAVSTSVETTYTACFKAGLEHRCYTVSIINTTKDPCGSSGDIISGHCQNGGKCFTTSEKNYQCFCPGNDYSGKNCSKGPCAQQRNVCSDHGFCLSDNGVTTCMCKAGFTNVSCQTDMSSTFGNPLANGAHFLAFGKPKQVNCNKNWECGTYAFVIGNFQSTESPLVEMGFVSEQLQDIKLETTKQLSTNSPFIASVTFVPIEVGDFYLCFQTMSISRVNKDEVCFLVHVTTGVGLLYGISDRPHFINPSLQPESTIECRQDEESHVLYTITSGKGNEHECIEYNVTQPESILLHVFSTCQPCIALSPSMANCTLDLAFRTSGVVNVNETQVCVTLLMKSSGQHGEIRCFNISTNTVRQTDDKEGCQILECFNGGFCDGHVKNRPVCYCKMGFTGTNCETNITDGINGTCKNTFYDISGSVSSEIRCSKSNCSYPFTVCKENSAKLVSGFVASQLDIIVSPQRDFNQNVCGCINMIAYLSSTSLGSFTFCLQIKDNTTGLVLDEICPKANFTSSDGTTQIVDQEKPYFLDPTLPANSVVLCIQNETCHLNVYYTDGQTLGVNQQCPTLKDSSLTTLVGLHMFPSQHTSPQCSNNLSYKPVFSISVGDVRTLCLKVSIPGKQGEERCFRFKIVINVKTEIASPCRGVTCFGDAVCTSGPVKNTGACVCPTGFVGANCSEKVNIIKDLPGVTGINLTSRDPDNPHFDLTHGIIKTLSCIAGQECVAYISYNGHQSRPPIKGFCNSSLSVTETVQSISMSHSNFHELLLNVNGTAGIYKCCYQTTINGHKESPNIDEICIEVNIVQQYNGVSGFMKEVQLLRPPANSTFICQANSTCHLSISTAPKNKTCDPIKQCKNGLAGTHIFDPAIGPDGMCFTDIGYTTEGQQSVKDLCIKSGLNSEEQHFVLEINNSQGFGPCQKKHCLNGGRCSSESSTPVCICKAGFTDYDCGTEEECKIGSIPSSITCGSSSCFLDFLVTGSTRMPSIVERSSGHLSHTVKQDGATYTFAIDVNAHNTTEVCLNISTGGHTSECNMSTCIAVKYTDTSSIGTPVLNCTTKDGKPGECDIVLITTKPLSNGECPQLFVHPDTTLERVHIFENMLINSTDVMPHCVSQVSAHTPNGSTQKLCIMDSAQIVMCLNTTVTQPACKASTGATTQAKQLVMTGMVSCVCKLESSEPINIIKRNPRPSTKALTKVAGFGASGMAGAMAVGVLIYLVIKKIKAKPSTVKCMNAKPQPAMKPKAEVAPAPPEVPSFLKRRQVRPEMAWEQGF